MAGQKPSPRTLDPQEEQKIQRFLERAAPLVLAGPELDAARWLRLSALAEELQLTPEQLRRTLQDLCERGVLKNVDAQSPKPPPLPSPGGRGDAAPPGRIAPDSNFSLTPPPRAARPPRRDAAPPAPSLEVRADERDEQPLVAAPDASPVDSAVPPPRPVLETPTPVDGDLDRWEVLRPDRRRRWRLDGDDACAPPPPRQEPAETFRGYVGTALDQSRERALSVEREQELVRHGANALGLAALYARDLVAEVARAKQFPRQTESPGAEDAYNERLAAFREFVTSALNRLNSPALTANVEQTLAEQGRMLFGIRAERVHEVVADAARERNLPVISRELAERHLRDLVAELLGEDAQLPRDARDRVAAEGKRWGLAPFEVADIVRAVVRANIDERQWERRFTNLALVAASCAVLLVIVFLSWAVLQSHFHSEPHPAGHVGAQPAARGLERDR